MADGRIDLLIVEHLFLVYKGLSTIRNFTTHIFPQYEWLTFHAIRKNCFLL